MTGHTTESSVEQSRTKLVRLREGLYATGAEYDSAQDMFPPARVVHLVDVTADLHSPDGVTVCCGLQCAPRTLEDAPDDLHPHKLCRNGP